MNESNVTTNKFNNKFIEAINILTSALEAANLKGVYTLKDSALISKAIGYLIEEYQTNNHIITDTNK